MEHLFDRVFAPGFFASAPVHTALAISGAAALVSGVIGVFTIMRGQSFAGHALADISSAGGSVSFLLGVNPLAGFLGMALVGASALGLVPAARTRERDIATGVLLGAGLGLSALLLHFAIRTTSTRGPTITVMFGSMFSIPPAIVPTAIAVAIGALIGAALLYRPLILSCVDDELAAARGVNARLVGGLHLALLALAVALSALTVGAVLSTALLVGPAATAIKLTDRPNRALLLAPLIGLAACGSGILLAYDSYHWTPGHGWPVSFFIVALIVLCHAVVSALGPRRGRPRPAQLPHER